MRLIEAGRAAAEQRPAREPAADGQRGPGAGAARAEPQPRARPAARTARASARPRRPPSARRRRRRRRTSHRRPPRARGRCSVISRAAAVVVADEPVGQPMRVRSPSDRPPARRALMAPAPEILHRRQHARADARRARRAIGPGRTRGSSRRSAEPNLVARHGRETARARAGSNGRERRAADDVPAAGRRGGIDAGLPAGDARPSPAGTAGARRGAARRGDPRIDLRHVGEPGHEADEVDAVLTRGVPRDDFLCRAAGEAPRRRRDPARASPP